MEFLPSLLGALATHAPVYIAWLIAIIVALVRWSVHPRVSLIALIAIASMWALHVGVMFIFIWMPFNLRAKGLTTMEIMRVNGVVSFVSSLVDAGCWAGIIVAMFGWRRHRV